MSNAKERPNTQPKNNQKKLRKKGKARKQKKHQR